MNDSGEIRIYVNSPPVDGKANEECIKLLSRTLGVAKSMIAVVKGAHARKKTISVSGITRDEFHERMRKAGIAQ